MCKHINNNMQNNAQILLELLQECNLIEPTASLFYVVFAYMFFKLYCEFLNLKSNVK